jgi:hypothetical protein
MNELEDRLRRYRPTGPPKDLRARVIATAGRPPQRRWMWMPSVAAAAAAFTFYVLAASARRDLAGELSRTDPNRDAIIRALAADLGGDEEARQVAARLVELNEATVAAGPETPLDVESDRHD